MSDQERLCDDRLAELRQDWREGLPIHEDDLGALLTEIEQRRAADRERETRQSTLSPDCWRDPRHHACAVARVEKAREIIEGHAALGDGDDSYDLGWKSCAQALLRHFDAALRGECEQTTAPETDHA